VRSTGPLPPLLLGCTLLILLRACGTPGAGSSLFEYTLRRLTGPAPEDFARAMAASFVISADMAHAVHPNFAEKHEANHQPKMNEGVVIKFNSNQRYATNAATASTLRLLAGRCGVPLQVPRARPPVLPCPPTGDAELFAGHVQDMVVRNDSACGSTIGPILASGLAIRTIGEPNTAAGAGRRRRSL
jgi:aspartyl aminopeptidase